MDTSECPGQTLKWPWLPLPKRQSTHARCDFDCQRRAQTPTRGPTHGPSDPLPFLWQSDANHAKVHHLPTPDPIAAGFEVVQT